MANKKNVPAVKEQRTSKKVKFVGTQKFMNVSTGEVIEMGVTEIAERDFNFSKVWMRNFLASLDLVGNQKTRVAFWIIDHLDKENRLICTNRRMADEVSCSLQTVSITMKILQEADFLRKIQSGVYMVNPDIVFKGGRNARLALCMDYHDIDYEKPKLTTAEKIDALESSIRDMQEEVARLKGMRDAVDVDIDPQLEFNAEGEIYQRSK